MMMKAMKLTAEQTEDLPFPIGCPVWYNFPEKSLISENKENSVGTEKEEMPILKQGVIESVSFNYGAKDLVYEVVYKNDDDDQNDIIEEVSEHKLAYGANCPVTVDFNDGDGSSEGAKEGTVLLCEPSSSDPNSIVYTAMIFMEGSKARYEFGIDAKRIRYRKVDKSNDMQQQQQNDGIPAAIIPPGDNQPATAPKPTEKVSALDPTVHHKNEAVPSSITCDSIAHSSSKAGGTGSGSKRTREPTIITPPSTAASPSKSQRVDEFGRRSATNHIQDGRGTRSDVKEKTGHTTQIVIDIPLWLQPDLASQKELFYYLIGSKRLNKVGVKDIGRETNCAIIVNFKPDSRGATPRGVAPQPPMTITVVCMSGSPQKDLRIARLRIEELMLAHPTIHKDGARGRLVCEMAASCGGAHRPTKSTSRAVTTTNPFSQRGDCMTVVDLPFEVYKGRREFHASYLLNSYIQDDIRRKGCYIKTCGAGKEYDIQTRCCDPYVFVVGRAHQGIDGAVDIVKDAIRRHMDKCGYCSLR